MRAKKVALVALGLVTLPHVMVVVPDGPEALPAFTKRNEPAVAVLTVQPEASPRLVGCDGSVEPVTEKPDGVVHEPLAFVQINASADRIFVPVVGSTPVKV